MVFCTKRNTYGHRRYLTVDFDKKEIEYTDRWFSSDFIELSVKQFSNIEKQFEELGFTSIIRL